VEAFRWLCNKIGARQIAKIGFQYLPVLEILGSIQTIFHRNNETLQDVNFNIFIKTTHALNCGRFPFKNVTCVLHILI
jgi:hypothetical protein